MKKENKKRLKEIEARNAPLNDLHSELFPEEYDFIYDSIADKRDRNSGINPMSQEYQDRVNKRRLEMGVAPFELSEELEQNDLISSWEYCRRRLAE